MYINLANIANTTSEILCFSGGGRTWNLTWKKVADGLLEAGEYAAAERMYSELGKCT